MKILFLIESLDKGGKERRMLELMKGLLPYPDINMELVLFSKRIHYQEVYELDIPIYILERKPKKDPRVFYRLFSLCKKIRPDIIHSWGDMPSVYAIPTVVFLGIKFMNAMIADAPNNMNILDKRLFRAKLTFPFSDLILGNSKAGLTAYKAPPTKSFCIYNGFDFNRVSQIRSPQEVLQHLEIQTPYVVGMIGAFEDRKDYQTYLNSAVQCLTQRDDVTFLAIGDGSRRKDFQGTIPERFKNHIRFTGIQKDIESIINIMDIGVLCTNPQTHGEGISNVIMEYMASGKPVIASKGGGTPEIVIDPKTGYLVGPQSETELTEKICHLLDNPNIRHEMGKAGKQRVENIFSIYNMVSTHYQQYLNLLTATVKTPEQATN